VRLMTRKECLLAPYDFKRMASEQTVLHALAGALAAVAGLELIYTGYDGEDPAVSAPLSFGYVDTETLAALQQSAEALGIRCMDFQPEHWDILCSLRRVHSLGLCLRAAAASAQLASHQIQSVQITDLRQLIFDSCNVPLQPVLQHLSALTLLSSLRFCRCSEGLSALSSGLPPLHRLSELQFSGCKLTAVPPLRRLLGLQELSLDSEPELRDVQLGLHGLTSLTKLFMQACSPIGEGTLDALKQLPGLRECDMRYNDWTLRNAAVLGRLQHWSHAQHIKLLV
jgi:hypothetical protein